VNNCLQTNTETDGNYLPMTHEKAVSSEVHFHAPLFLCQRHNASLGLLYKSLFDLLSNLILKPLP